MAIHNEQQREMGAGIRLKKIDEGAMNLMFNMAQKDQYQFPIKSTVRELLSNGVDSVADMKSAIEILTGKAKPEDYYIIKEGALFKDSKWQPDYYDLNWLSNDDQVTIEYVIGQGTNKDRVVIEDHGVGLGGKRLEQHFNLGFSTKRLSKLPIGKWGAGGKVALSTGIDFYTTESKYNGKLFRFNVYDRGYQSIIPRFNMVTGEENPYILFDEGTEDEDKVYYEGTTEKNGVSVSFEVKKHHRQAYIDGVKSQMLYFDNIAMYLVHEDGHRELVPHKATILYEDEHIILSDNPYYSKPHVLLNRVTYGYIQWDELELEEKIGNIGIKVDPSEVEVNMSRESLKWGELTKSTILNKFGTVVDIATRFINDTLKENDFWRWIKKCYSISARYSEQGGIIGRLAKIVDLTQVDPLYPKDTSIKFKQDIGDYLDFDSTVITYTTVNRKNEQKKVVDRKSIKNLGGFINLPVILRGTDERASNRKDKYLLSIYPQGFLLMTQPFSHYRIQKGKEDWDEKQLAEHEEWMEKRKKWGWISSSVLWDYMLQSKDPIAYGSIEVPKDFTGTEEEEEIKDEEETVEDVKQAEVIRQTAEERRKLEGKIIVNTPRATIASWTKYYSGVNGKNGYDPISTWTVPADSRAYEWQKIEVPIKDINDWDAEEIYYCKEDDSEMAHFVAMLTRDPHPDNRIGYGTRRSYAENLTKWKESKWYRLNSSNMPTDGYYAMNCQHFYDAQVMLVKASQANLKYLRDFRPIQEFFIKIKNNKVTMSNTLVQWNTARKIKDELAKAAFLYNFEQFNPKYADLYKQLTQYVDKHYREVQEQTGNGLYGLNAQVYGDLLSHLENVYQLQNYVMNNPDDKEGIAAIAGQLFGNKELKDGMAVDPEMIDNLNQVLEFAAGCGTMLNYINTLTGYDGYKSIDYRPGQSRGKYSIPEELELEIKQYLEYKGMLTYGTNLSENSNENPFMGTQGTVKETSQSDTVLPEESGVSAQVSSLV